MEIIRYSMLLEEAAALVQLKQTLGHFDSSDDRKRFRDIAHSIVNELASALWLQLESGDVEQYVLLKLVEDGMILQMFYDISEQWKEIRNVRLYVTAAIQNLFGRVLTAFACR